MAVSVVEMQLKGPAMACLPFLQTERPMKSRQLRIVFTGLYTKHAD